MKCLSEFKGYGSCFIVAIMSQKMYMYTVVIYMISNSELSFIYYRKIDE